MSGLERKTGRFDHSKLQAKGIATLDYIWGGRGGAGFDIPFIYYFHSYMAKRERKKLSSTTYQPMLSFL